MGGCFTTPEFDDSLNKSLIAKLITDPDELSLFSSICKCENYNLSKRLVLSKKDAFYIVISGEVIATMTHTAKSVSKSKQILTYFPGDLIPIYNGSIVSDGDFIAGDYRVSFSIKSSSDGVASILSIEKTELREYLITRPSLTLFQKFVNLNLAEIQKTLGLGALTSTEFELVFSLTKPLMLSQGDLLFQEGEDVKPSYGKGFSVLSDMGVLMIGTALTLNPGTDQHQVRGKLYQRARACRGRGLRISGSLEGGIISSADLPLVTTQTSNSFWEAFRLSSLPRVHYEDQSDLSFAVDGTLHLSSSLFGLELLACPGSHIGLWNVMSLQDSVVGYFSPDLLGGLLELCPVMSQAFTLHLKERLVREAKSSVPLIKDLSPSQQEMLVPFISIQQFRKGDVIYQQGFPGQSFYILQYGSVQESFHDDSKNKDQSKNKEGSSQEIQTNVLARGQHFGEVCMVMGIPYSHTITCLENVIALRIDSKDFRSVMQADRLKMSELKIRLLGAEVELMHLLDHSEGYQLVVNFLKKELASENLEFWHHVDRFEELSVMLLKQFRQIFESSAVAAGVSQLTIDRATHDSQLHIGPAIKEDEDEEAKSKPGSPSKPPPNNAGWMEEQAPTPSSPDQRNQQSFFVPRLSMSSLDHESLLNFSLPTPSAKVRRLTSVEVRTAKESLMELRELGNSIMSTFIKEGSASQVNIPGKMRIETEGLFSAWVLSVMKVTEIEEQSQSRIYIPRTHPQLFRPPSASNPHHPSSAPHSEPNPSEVLMPHLAHLPHAESSPELQYEEPTRQEDLKAALLNPRFIFRKSKKEVYELLRKDTFVRFKQTAEFANFIVKLKPYESHTSSSTRLPGGAIHNNNKN